MERQGATSSLMVHIVVRKTTTRVLRAFSVTDDFEPGGKPIHFAQMDLDTRNAVEQTWREIENADRANFDPAHAVFSLAKARMLAGASGWENFVLIFKCNKFRPAPHDPRAALILCHISIDSNTEQISMKHQFMVTPDCELGALQGSYDWLEGAWRSSVKQELARMNNYEENITKHPWALKKMYRTITASSAKKDSIKTALEGISLICEFQGVEPQFAMSMLEGNHILNAFSGPALSGSASNVNVELGEPTALPPYSVAGNQ